VLVRTEAGAVALERIVSEVDHLPIEHPEALERLDRLDKKIAFTALNRPFDPAAPLFIDFTDHVERYAAGDRAPVWRGR
jgi:coenzyme F420 hydrogenase subunit beta